MTEEVVFRCEHCEERVFDNMHDASSREERCSENPINEACITCGCFEEKTRESGLCKKSNKKINGIMSTHKKGRLCWEEQK